MSDHLTALNLALQNLLRFALEAKSTILTVRLFRNSHCQADNTSAVVCHHRYPLTVYVIFERIAEIPRLSHVGPTTHYLTFEEGVDVFNAESVRLVLHALVS